jgi:DNA-binding response OmpR family regulator
MKKKARSVAAKGNILVIEDDWSLLNVVTDKLKKEGWKVTQARSVRAGLYWLANKPIDALWLDHGLLGTETGIDLLRMLPKSERQRLKTVIVTNHDEQIARYKYSRLRVNSYFIKSNSTLTEVCRALEV